jgi:predicted RNase H-like nuclease (RuvC/YqgF family)
MDYSVGFLIFFSIFLFTSHFSSVKAKLNAINKEEEERRKAEELEAEKIANGKKTPAEVAELRRVKKQQERIEKLNTQIAAEKAELQRQLEETKKHAEDLTKQYQHARREGAHFAREVDRLAYEKATLEKVAEKLAATLPEQLNMTSMQISAEKAHQLQSEHNVADADASANALSLEDEDDLPPAERTKKLEVLLKFFRSLLMLQFSVKLTEEIL